MPSPCAGPGGTSWYWLQAMRCTTGSGARFPAWPAPMTPSCIIPALPLFRRCFIGSACRGRTPACSAHIPAKPCPPAPLPKPRFPSPMPEAATPPMPSRRQCSNSIPRPPNAPPSLPNASVRPRNTSFQAHWRIWPALNAALRPSCFCFRTIGATPPIASPALPLMSTPAPAKTPPQPAVSRRRYSPLGFLKKTMNAKTT